VRSFHLVAVAPGRVPRLARAIWNGTQLVWRHGSGPALFTSSSVDPEGARRIRGAGWRRFLRRRGLDPVALGTFMASHDPEPGPLSVCMHRPEAVTVSRILVQVEGRRASLTYLDGPPCAPVSVATRRLALAGRS
jgi:hypothetical protein